jgi:hypothetical protein
VIELLLVRNVCQLFRGLPFPAGHCVAIAAFMRIRLGRGSSVLKYLLSFLSLAQTCNFIQRKHCQRRSTHCRSCCIADMTPPECSEWTVTEASKRQFGAGLFRPVCVCLWLCLRCYHNVMSCLRPSLVLSTRARKQIMRVVGFLELS